MLFSEMGLRSEIMNGIRDLGYETPTPIQEKVIPLLLSEKRDIIGLAQTGTGKTAAFGLPALMHIEVSNLVPQLLVLSPTRELCMQIAGDLENYSKYLNGIKIVAVYGGAPIDRQIMALRHGVHIIVATPGRMNDLIRRKKVNLSQVVMLVLDEADEMLKMGFRDEVDTILAETPKEKNTMLFSATMSNEIAAIAKNYMHSPVEVTMGKKNSSAESVNHIYHMVMAKDRYAALKRVVDYYPEIYGIVFCRTRQDTKDVAAALMRDGYDAEALHGDLTQAQRDYVMQKFRERNLSVLVATDVAARGLDVTDLTHVINYMLPEDVENYTHRTGRTGRAGKEGTAVSIIHTKEKGKIFEIERVINRRFNRLPVPNGKEICERQLLSLVDKMQQSEVNHEQIDPFMEAVYEKLADISKEELIKRFVSVEFNRFLDYYRDAEDLNIEERSHRHVEPAKEGRRRGSGKSMSRVLFNLGKGKDISKKEVIDLMVKASGRRDIEVGQIEVFKRATAVEVDSKMAKKIISELNRMTHKGVRVEAEENYEFIGNDFRDRNKGPRGKKHEKNY
jgi:ATP-dependent RNA helicase DeaD